MTKFKVFFEKVIVAGVKSVQKLVDDVSTDENIHLVSRAITPEQLQDIKARLNYYVPGRTLTTHSHLPLFVALSSQPALVFGEYSLFTKKYGYYRGGLFDIDHLKNHLAGWAWFYLAEYCAKEKTDLPLSFQRFKSAIDSLRKQHLEKVYIFGTGPSLSKAGKMDWSDGYRIVCNTIVRDPDLWHKINPHFIVAGDAIYHFSDTKFARAFRKDLALRLSETNTYFVFPAMFYSIVRREMREYADRLIPIPDGTHTTVNVDLCQDFNLPRLGNVLPCLLLPLGCTLGKAIFLWGFDGRAPTDQLFWANSAKHSYPEFLPELKENFPAFFDHFVPANNPSQYVNTVHGDVLEECLQSAEKEGWYFEMLHKSWTPTLQKRCKTIN
ncbi:MAG: hypothetical protein C0410_02680 [Anaerolinea sp.]|nr:hypothetical protein [Anaerolinea sp.]